MTPVYLVLANPNDPLYKELGASSERISTLLNFPGILQWPPVLACLDDLLGAVYSLFYARHHGFADRSHTLTAPDIANVGVRATDMASLKVRIEGRWTAGYYFNSALFRIASVYHRGLQYVVGTQERMEVLVRRARDWFKKSGSTWSAAALGKVNAEVNELKHLPRGIFTGRSIAFADAIEAVRELLTLFEASQRARFVPLSDPTKQDRLAAIEHVVYEYANLISAGSVSLHGPAPMRTHADDAFMLGCRKIGDFLMDDVRRYGDDVLALDYIPPGSTRTWDLPTWTTRWRSAMNKQLNHIAYKRVRNPQQWNHLTYVPLLLAEFRAAWGAFQSAVGDSDLHNEYANQLAAVKRNRVSDLCLCERAEAGTGFVATAGHSARRCQFMWHWSGFKDMGTLDGSRKKRQTHYGSEKAPVRTCRQDYSREVPVSSTGCTTAHASF